jgi:hypothetical protein
MRFESASNLQSTLRRNPRLDLYDTVSRSAVHGLDQGGAATPMSFANLLATTSTVNRLVDALVDSEPTGPGQDEYAAISECVPQLEVTEPEEEEEAAD